jgi:hypothetical protein
LWGVESFSGILLPASGFCLMLLCVSLKQPWGIRESGIDQLPRRIVSLAVSMTRGSKHKAGCLLQKLLDTAEDTEDSLKLTKILTEVLDANTYNCRQADIRNKCKWKGIDHPDPRNLCSSRMFGRTSTAACGHLDVSPNVWAMAGV